MSETRVCRICDVEKEVDQFRTYQAGRRRRRVCRICEGRQRRKRKVPNTPERLEQMRRARFIREYGITPEQYDQMVEDRQGRCDICGELPQDNRGSKLHIDHVEGTKIVRGLLCLTCNVGIGMLKHNLKRIKRAYHYLRR